MSGFISEPERNHEHHLATDKSKHGDSKQIQGLAHDRMAGGSSKHPEVTSYESDEETTEMDITAGQKMLSAVSGSLLTSILGTAIFSIRTFLFGKADKHYCSHTSRCRSCPPSISAFHSYTLCAPRNRSQLKVHQSSPKSRRYSMLPRGILGQQQLAFLYGRL